MRSRTLEGPAYLRIHRELRARLLGGRYAAHEALPSQRALSEEFGVTLMTLRQALDLLKDEGLLVTRPGAGTFAVPRRFAYSIGPLRSLAQEMASQGLSMCTEVLNSTARKIPPDAAQRLGVEPGEQGWFLERVRSVEGDVAVYQRSYLPAGIGRALRRHDLSRRSLYEVLSEELGVVVARASERLYPVVLRAYEARLLTQPRGAAAMLSERTTFDAAGLGVLFDQAFIPGSRMVITAERRASGMSIRYELRDPAPGQDGAALVPRRGS